VVNGRPYQVSCASLLHRDRARARRDRAGLPERRGCLLVCVLGGGPAGAAREEAAAEDSLGGQEYEAHSSATISGWPGVW